MSTRTMHSQRPRLALAKLLRVVFVAMTYLAHKARGCKDAEEAFHLTNKFRSQCGVGPVTWSEDLARSAGEWARLLVSSTCQPTHSPPGFRNFAGENLTLGPHWKNSDFCAIAAQGWFDEHKNYRFTNRPWTANRGQFERIGHYSQTVWKETTSMGCGSAVGDDCAVVVCHYWPRGNMATDEAFYSNVRPVRAHGVSAKMPFPSQAASRAALPAKKKKPAKKAAKKPKASKRDF